tara:strand:+ start:416 stop:658 length:243 start_codon:yes stop_codon:yes gene_type:complete
MENLILAVPVIGVLVYMLNYFMKVYEKEKEINKQRDKQDSKIIEGLKYHVEESNKKHDTQTKKQDETIIKVDNIIRKLDR